MRTFISCLFAVLFVSSVHAQEFYKWVDADGVTHYGEKLPNPETEYETLEIPAKYVTGKPGDDYYSIQNQLKRIQEQRLLWRELNTPVRQQEKVIVEEVRAEPEVVRYVPAYPYHYKYPYYKNKHYYGNNKKYRNNKHGKKRHDKKYKKNRIYKHAKQLRNRNSYSKSSRRNSALIVKVD